GCAYVHLRYKTTGNSKKTESPFASSIPQRMTIKGKGALLYDPRLDSTVGGSGSQRADDQSTWAWTSDAAGNNPALQMLWYLLGWRINGKLAVGRGIPKSRILMSAFIAAANLCEEAVSLAAGGSEPRYRSSGVVSEADAPSAVIDAIEASCAGTLRDASGRLALDILHNDRATALSPGLTDADVIGQCDWQQTKSLDESFNVVRGRYTDPSNNALYQLVDYPAVSLPSPDGLERIHVFDLSMVQSASQAQRLAKQELQRAQYQGVFKGEFKATAWRCQVGSIVPFTFSALGFSNKLFRVVEQVVRMDGTCGLVLREENAAIYAWATEETAPVQAAAPTPYDPNNSPLILGIIEGDNPNSLTINEKISDRIPKENERSGTNGRYLTVRARMVALGLSVTALDSASAAWIAHRDAVPGWNNTSFHSTIVRTTWDALDKAFDDQLNLGDIAISQEDAKRAVVGGGVTDTYGNPVALDQVRNNLALVDWWKRLAAVPWAYEWPNVSRQIISVPNDFNIPGPVAGRPDDVMFCADTNGGSSFGGGWEPTAADGLHLAPLDPDKTYRFALPFRKPSGNGGIYWGTLNVADLNTGTLNTNPYFVSGWTGYQTDRWYLAVGYIYPRNSVGRTHDGAGVFDLKTGAKVATGLNFCFHPSAAQPNHRAFQYYATIANSQVVFGRPLVNLVDGTEPSLREYFETGAVLNSAIQIDANGNFVNPVGTGSGTNVSTALVAKKLTSLGSVAAIIEGNSFRRSTGDSDYNCWVAGEPIVGACFAEAVVAAGAWTMVAL
ncbi:hypothetical protein K4H03_20625, partial [Mycobacterium tuberculosis]|nr:hypothetical protein [Mycobacterium tuberculosis]